ncbi:gamma-glutamyl-gamma-aminobutyrate hydrolase family protein [Sporolactobacillus pectinivorans]|uniref:gamma-glutamyl-gamma-aminobutyrate hydrolase family protein n=1 Tax=Sporolactobacillus pectinivorans TaxID=1591408 RepID=UPI000C2636AB|nr:gamma-glutamyl-gamma-aminobutyrate hydrolase family protein [Sporolactobacillus pectinivorans]
MGKKPVIGVTTGFAKRNEFSQGPYVHQDYEQSLFLTGAVPVLLPVAPDGLTDHYLDLCDGIIFSGGGDVDPRFYDEPPSPYIEPFDITRDRFEILLMKKAVEAGKPILCICRGMQVLNVAFGGTLVQDLGTEWKHPIQHDQKIARMKTSHSVQLLHGNRLSQLLEGQDSLYVNSLHHQAVKELAPGFRAAALAPDGVVEAMEHEANDRIISVQWHPESMAAGGDSLMRHLFQFFVVQCSLSGEKMS